MKNGQKMLQDAHQEVIRNLQTILQGEVQGNSDQNHNYQPLVFDVGTETGTDHCHHFVKFLK